MHETDFFCQALIKRALLVGNKPSSGVPRGAEVGLPDQRVLREQESQCRVHLCVDNSRQITELSLAACVLTLFVYRRDASV
jgi:hypothetical protein